VGLKKVELCMFFVITNGPGKIEPVSRGVMNGKGSKSNISERSCYMRVMNESIGLIGGWGMRSFWARSIMGLYR
jgi:hypothetical protein